jgi:hypothetical protein
LACTSQARLFHRRFAVLKSRLCIVVGAASLAALALIQAKENMFFKIGFVIHAIQLFLRLFLRLVFWALMAINLPE